jgi:hypothetical protein
MSILHDEESPPGKPIARKAWWLPRLENELKRRVGWVDEVVSPFARASRTQKSQIDLRRAA